MKRNKTVALLSYSLAITLVFTLAPILGQTTIQHVSAETCSGAWDATVSGLKLSYQPGENIDVVVSFKARNPAGCPDCIQQILVGMVDQNGKAVDVYCVYNGQAMVCPSWTTGDKAIRLKAPSVTGTYKIVAANEYQYNCQDAQAKFFRQPTGPLKEIASINIEAKACNLSQLLSGIKNALSHITNEGYKNVLTGIQSCIGQSLYVVTRVVLPLLILVFILIIVWKRRKGLYIQRLMQKMKELINPGLFDRLYDAIKSYEPPRNTTNEQAYQFALYENLKPKFPSIEMEVPLKKERGRIDLVVDYVGIEIKGLSDNASLERLPSQIGKYSADYNHIIVVLFMPKYDTSYFDRMKHLVDSSYPNLRKQFIIKNPRRK